MDTKRMTMSSEASETGLAGGGDGGGFTAGTMIVSTMAVTVGVASTRKPVDASAWDAEAAEEKTWRKSAATVAEADADSVKNTAVIWCEAGWLVTAA